MKKMMLKFGLAMPLVIGMTGTNYAQGSARTMLEDSLSVFASNQSSKLKSVINLICENPKLLEEAVDAAANRVVNSPAAPQNPKSPANNDQQNSALKQQTWIDRELSRYRMTLPIPLPGTYALNENFAVTGRYERTVQPTFVEGEQQRLDVYILNFGAQAGYINGGAEVRLTFSRIFKKQDGINLKLQAFKAKAYCPDRLPRSADDALKNMNPNELTRLEISGQVGAGIGQSNETTGTTVGVGGSYNRSALLLVDMYKPTGTALNMKILGLKNRGTYNFGISAVHPITRATEFFNADWFGRLFTIGAGFNINKTDPIAYSFPIDTLMTDYSFDLRYPEVKDAVNEIFTNIGNGGFLALFNPIEKDADLAKDLLTQAAKAEALAKLDAQNPPDQPKRVKHEFIGRMTSKTFSLTMNAGLSELAYGSIENGGLSSFVRTFDVNGNPENYILENSFSRMDGGMFFGRNTSALRYEIDVLARSDENHQSTELLDLVSKTEMTNSEMSKQNLQDLKNTMSYGLPKPIADEAKIDSFIPNEVQNGASVRYQINFGGLGFAELRKLDRTTVYNALYKFIENHPHIHRMGLNVGTSTKNNPEPQKLETYVSTMTDRLMAGLTGSTVEKQVAGFRELKNDKVFSKYLAWQFLPTLLPEAEVKNLMQLAASFSSSEEKLRGTTAGTLAPSKIYNAVSFLKRVLNDRSLDLSLIERDIKFAQQNSDKTNSPLDQRPAQ